MFGKNQPKQKSKFQAKINNLSEAQRQSIFKLLMAILISVVVLAWIPTLKISVEKILSQPDNPILNETKTDELKQSLDQMFQQTQQHLQNLQERFDQLMVAPAPTSSPSSTPARTATSTTTTTPELTNEELQMLKEKILERSN